MSFLAPLFLLGGLAVGLPILFHLTRRSTRKRQVFSTLMFLRTTPPRFTRRNQVEHVLLLLVRCAVIGLLAFAFARPFFRQPTALVPHAAPPKRVVALLDTSASLRRTGLWTQSVAQFRRVLDELAAGDDLAILTFDRQTRTLLSFDRWRDSDPQQRRGLALRLVDEVKPGWAATRLDLGLMAAAELLDEADALSNDAVDKQIQVFTDLQSGAQLNALQGYTWPAGIEVVPQSVQPSVPGNAGLQWLVSTRTESAAAAPAVIRVRLTNAADSREDQFEVRWAGGTQAPPVRAQVPPGQSRVFGLPVPTGLEEGTRLDLFGDASDFDNRIHTIPEQLTERHVWFWADDPIDDPQHLGFYLGRAFPATKPRKTVFATLGRNSDEATTNVHALVITTGELSTQRIAAARDWVDHGGTILWILDRAAAADGLRELMQNNSLTASEAPVNGYSLLEQIDFQHPLFAPFADPRYSDFTRIHFWRHRHFGFGNLPGARVLARFDNGDPALVELPRGNGRVLVLAAGWQPADGQLALSSKFVPLLHALAEYAAGAPTRQSQYYAGDPVPLPTVEAGPVTIQLPDHTSIKVSDGTFQQTAEPGIYLVSQGSNHWRFAVNVDPAESRTRPMLEDDLERAGIPLSPEITQAAPSPQKDRHLREAELEGRQKLWRWLILGTLLILGVESLLAGRMTRAGVGDPAG